MNLLQLTRQKHLGNCVKKYEDGSSSRSYEFSNLFLLTPFIWFTLYGAIEISYYSGSPDLFRKLLYLLNIAVCGSIGIWYLYKAIAHRKDTQYLYEQGFVDVVMGKPTAIHFDDIKCVWQQITNRYFNRSFGYQVHQYVFLLHDGRYIHTNKQEIGERAQQVVFQNKFLRTVEKYATGESLEFGALTISKQGVTNAKKTFPWSQKKTLPWSDAEIIPAQGFFNVLNRNSQKIWMSIPIIQIPNVHILLELSKRVYRSGELCTSIAKPVAKPILQRSSGYTEIDQVANNKKLGNLLAKSEPAYQNKFFIYEDGFVVFNQKTMQGFRYNEITEVYQKNTTIDQFIPGNLANYRKIIQGLANLPPYEIDQPSYLAASAYQLRTQNGAKITCQGWEAFRYIKVEVFCRQFPLAMAAYQTGKMIDFGPFSLSQQGITFRAQSYPWSSIQNAQLQQSLNFLSLDLLGNDVAPGLIVLIYQKTEAHNQRMNQIAAVKIDEIPNFDLFWILINHLFRTKGQWQFQQVASV